MTAMGIHSKPIDGIPVANGHALKPWPNAAERPRTPPNAAGRRRTDGTAFIVVALFAVAQVAVVAFSGSWQHQYELSIHLGQAHWVAGMQPLSVEGLIVSTTLVIWYAARHGYRKRDIWGAYLVLAVGIGQTVLMNLGADYRWPWLGPEISIWPAVAFVAAYEMAVWLVRRRQDGAVQPHVDNPADKAMDKQVDKPAPRKSIPPRTAMDKAAAAIADNPALADKKAWTALAEIAGVSAKTIKRASNAN